MSQEKQGDKSVYYHEDKFMHVVKVVNKNSGPASQNGLKRWAFLVVGYEEARSIIEANESLQAIRDAIKDKYLPYIKDAYAKEVKNMKTSKVRSYQMVEKKGVEKRISTGVARSKNSQSLGLLIEGSGFKAEHDILDMEHKEKGETCHYLRLKLSTNECENYLDKEVYETKTEVGKPYAVVAMPFYHKKKGIQLLEGAMYDSLTSVALMPRRVIEYGVFFDGTANNKYNIDFYRSFDKFLQKEARFVELNKDERLPEKQKDEYKSGAEYIVTVEKPEKDQVIMDMIRKEIVESVRYFEEDTLKRDEYKSWFQDDASDHAEKVFEFLVDVKENNKIEYEIDKAVKAGKIKNDAKSRDWYRPLVFQEYIEKKILPSDAKGSSYVNGVTNISRLYDLYDGHDELNTPKTESKDAHLEHFDRFKVYASGSGTIDPHDEKELDTDSLVGLGLAGGETGMRAHIMYTCQKMADELRHAGVYYVDELVLDVFGFSRGATEARHFVCSILEEFNLKETAYRTYTLDTTKPLKKGNNIFSSFFESQNGQYGTVNGVCYYNPLSTGDECSFSSPYKKANKLKIRSVSFRFVGIYDTVSHEGIKQSNDQKYLNMHFSSDKVGRVIHMRAKDEYRYNFETTSIKKSESETLSDNMEEIMLPGAHADVGGAYKAGADYSPIVYRGTKVICTGRFSGFGVSNEDVARLEFWNNKYGWLDNSKKLIKISHEEEMKKNKIDGFYYLSNLIYMYRQNLSNGYEFVTLNLMYDKAIQKDANASKLKKQKVDLKRELVPFKNIARFEKGRFKVEEQNNIAKNSNTELKGFLKTIYTKLKNADIVALDDSELKKLRRHYLHHSSNFSSIANPPSKVGTIGKKEIYGQRVVYGSQGEQFSYDKR